MASSQPEFTRSFDLSQRAATKTSSYWLLQRNTHYSLPGEPHTVVELWRLAARAYHFAKREDDKNRCRSAAAEHLVLMAERQPMAMMASSILSDAISELRGLPGKRDRRRELRHRVVDVQAGISEEMSGFSVPMNLEDIIKAVEAEMRLPTLRDQLFMFAGLDRSPDPAQLATYAAKSIREHPLSSLFAASHHDHEGKVIHRTESAGLGDDMNDSALQGQISRDEEVRRQLHVENKRRRVLDTHRARLPVR